MNGASGTYAINGTEFTMQPTLGKWADKDIVGVDGNGRPIYPALTQFSINWGYMSTADFKQINDFYLSVENTGTVVIDLPKHGDANYIFYSYSGTVLSRPTVGEYFNEYLSSVGLVVSNIRTS